MSAEPLTLDAMVAELLARALDAAATRPLPEATYRLQFHAGFPFREATRLAGYLRDLGVTHCYASPYLKARPGSQHGYDIIDHRRLNPEIGNDDEYAAWVAALRDNGLGQILDVVPNHMAVVGNENQWWNDVLENGPSSPYAEFFDIDWQATSRPGMQGRILIPVLGESYGKVLETKQLQLRLEGGEFAIWYFEHRFPVAPRSYLLILGQRLEELDRTLGAEAPAAIEYHSIVTAAKNLPRRTETDPARIAERQREKEVIKRRLAALIAESPRVGEFIQETVALYNGRAGEPDSFNLLEQLLDDQVYRLASWRVAAEEINYRRFFDINELAALSMERPEVFAATHALVFQLLREGKVEGLRIDHPDGLFDPEQYLRRLQEEYLLGAARTAFDADVRFREIDWAKLDTPLREHIVAHLAAPRDARRWPLYVIVEKILAAGEALADSWPTHGTSGYDFLNAANGLFVDGREHDACTRLYHEWTGDSTPFAELAYEKKTLVLQNALTSELQVLSHQLDRLAQKTRWSRDFTFLSLRRALREVIACFPVYRSYVAGSEIHEADRRSILRAIRKAMLKNPTLSAGLFVFLRDMLLLKPLSSGSGAETELFAAQSRFVGKFQQVTAPVMAKGIEDTAFYCYNRLLALNEVGGDAEQFGLDPADLHQYLAQRRTRWPHALSASSTHDTKRSEDVRARLNVLSEMPHDWAEHVARWSRLNEPQRIASEDGPIPDANDEFFIYQTLLGAWPLDDDDFAQFIQRLKRYLLKAVHEAKVHTSWINPNAAYDEGIVGFVGRILDPELSREFLDDFRPIQHRVSQLGMLNSLAQTVLKIASPGTPDIYQGNELWDFSLADPDNRRPVDYGIRQRLLKDMLERWQSSPLDLARRLLARPEDGAVKLFATWRTLQCRREHPGLFSTGAYEPLEATGSAAEHVFAFRRQHEGTQAVVALPRLMSKMLGKDLSLGSAAIWLDTSLRVPAGPQWRNLFTGQTVIAKRGGLRLQAMFADFPVCVLLGPSRG